MSDKKFTAFVLVEVEGETFSSAINVAQRIKTAIETGAAKYSPIKWYFRCAHDPEVKWIEPPTGQEEHNDSTT